MAIKSTTVRIIKIAARLSSVVAPPLAVRLLERLFTMPLEYRAPARETEWMSSAERTYLQFDNQRRIPIYTWGDAGPTALLVHGWAGRAGQMAVYAAPLVEAGYRVVAFDAPAHGNADGRFSALPELALAIERIATEIGPIRAIVAHSMGTAATTLALSRGVPAERLVYLAPPEELSRFLTRLSQFMGFSDEIAPRVQKRLERRYGVPLEEARGSVLAPNLTVPLLVIHDHEDRDVPIEEGRRLVNAWPGAKLIETHGLGHTRIIRRARIVKTAIRFLTETPNQRADAVKATG